MAAIVAVAVLIAGSIWYFGGSDHETTASTTSSTGVDSPTAPGTARPPTTPRETQAPKKADITTLSEGLLLDRSQFAGFPGDRWTSKVTGADAGSALPDALKDATYSPSECDIRNLIGTLPTETGLSQLATSNTRPMEMTGTALHVGGSQMDIGKDRLEKCPEVTMTRSSGNITTTSITKVRKADVSGLPSGAVAYTLDIETNTSGGASIHGTSKSFHIDSYCRGVMVETSYSVSNFTGMTELPADVGDKLAQLFNAQVATLEAAP